MNRLDYMQQRLANMKTRLGRLDKERKCLLTEIDELKAQKKERVLQRGQAVKLLTAGKIFAEAGILDSYDKEAVIKILGKYRKEICNECERK